MGRKKMCSARGYYSCSHVLHKTTIPLSHCNDQARSLQLKKKLGHLLTVVHLKMLLWI